jgi:hypothetical protein
MCSKHNCEINILYFEDNTSTKYFWETEWIKWLFASFNNITINHINLCEQRVQNYDNPIFIMNGTNHEHMVHYIRNYSGDKPYSIIHLSDEFYTHDIRIYNDPLCKHIFRNYYSKILTPQHSHACEKIGYCENKITYFPLGYKMDFWKNYSGTDPRSLSCNMRKYKWSFCGGLFKNNRQNIINNLKHISPHYIHSIRGWNTSDSLGTEDYRNIMLDSIIIPCLSGNANVDTFRLWEALECGCIPVVSKNQKLFGNYNGNSEYDYYRELLGDHPLPTIENWMDTRKLDDLFDNEDALEQLRIEIYNWYVNTKNNYRNAIRNILESTMHNNICECESESENGNYLNDVEFNILFGN